MGGRKGRRRLFRCVGALDGYLLVIDYCLRKTATVADLRNDFRRVSVWVSDGQSVDITKRGRVVARLVPPDASAGGTGKKPYKMPDFAAQRKVIWGDKSP
jgi:antitoxin (DNA-binding transcriptional repressor) of toxin-antitoxin stability system